jgi:hypothetical protein
VITAGPDAALRIRILRLIGEGRIGWIATTSGGLKICQIQREPAGSA